MKTSWKRLEDVLKTSLQDIFKKFWRCFQDVFKTSCRLPQDILQTFDQDESICAILKTSWRRLVKIYDQRHLEDMLKTSSQEEGKRLLHWDEYLLRRFKKCVTKLLILGPLYLILFLIDICDNVLFKNLLC